MSMLFSWKLAYLNCIAFVQRVDGNEETIPINISNAESLDHGEGEKTPRSTTPDNMETLLDEKPEKVDPFE